MTSLPPAAAGLSGGAAPGASDGEMEPTADQAPPRAPEGGQPAAATTHNGGGHRPAGSGAWEPRVPPVRASSAAVELTLDLRGTAPDKALPRVLGALERVSDDVTLIVLLRDTPEFVGVVTSIFSALRQRGYWSDSSRFPAGVQRLKIARRQARGGRQDEPASRQSEAVYSPPPAAPVPDENGG